MTDLVRRALLGDREAQEECTRQGIVLPCPFCGAKAEIDVVKKGYKSIISCKTHWCGFLRHSYNNGDTDVNVARRLLSIWNTRHAPPIVRCGECIIHNNCLTEDTFKIARIDDPFCCAGKRSEQIEKNTDFV